MKSFQYSIRGVPARLDAVLRERARADGVSLNQAALMALAAGVGLDREPRRYNDMDDLVGTWVHDPETEKALAEMDQVDEELWK